MPPSNPHPATEYCGAPYTSPGSTGSTAQPNPGSANSTDQYVPKHFPFPWFASILQSGDCNAAHIANVFVADQRSVPRPPEARRRPRRSAGSRRTTALTVTTPCATATTSRADSPIRTRRTPGQLHRRALRRRPVPRARDPGDRGVAGVQGRRSDRHHVRRGVPALHLHGQQLRRLDRSGPELHELADLRQRRRDAVRPERAVRAHGPERSAADQRRGRRAVPGPGLQRLHRPSGRLRRADGSAETGGDVPAGLGRHAGVGFPAAHRSGGDRARGHQHDHRQPRGGQPRRGPPDAANGGIQSDDRAARSAAPGSRRAPSSGR